MNYEGEAWAKVSQWAPGCAQSKFSAWVQRKANALWKRDKKKLTARECKPPTADDKMRAEYRQAIYKAIVDMKENKCPYTGKVLRWNLIGEWKNDEAKKAGKAYKKKFENLPTVDHRNAEPVPDFVICSWVANDAKNDLPYDEFVDLCRVVVTFADKKSSSDL